MSASRPLIHSFQDFVRHYRSSPIYCVYADGKLKLVSSSFNLCTPLGRTYHLGDDSTFSRLRTEKLINDSINQFLFMFDVVPTDSFYYGKRIRNVSGAVLRLKPLYSKCYSTIIQYPPSHCLPAVN